MRSEHSPRTYQPVSQENLDALVESLLDYKKKGVVDPWILRTQEGETEIIEPLDTLIELQDLRSRLKELEK